MKRLLTATLALAFVCTAVPDASAQRAKEMRGGLLAGVTFSDLTGDDIGTADSRFGLMLGAWGGYWLTNNVGLAIEANWHQSGAENITTPGDPDDILPGIRTSIIQVPAFLTLGVQASESLSLTAFGGFALNWTISCNVNFATGGTTCANTPEGGGIEDHVHIS